MPLHLPDFRQEFLQGLSFCSTAHLDDASQFGELPMKAFARYHAQGANADAMLVVILESRNDDDDVHYHFHIDLDRADTARGTSGLTEFAVDDLKERIARLNGHTVFAYIAARYAVPLSSIPKRGMIDTLLGVSTRTCGYELELRGSKFALQGDPLFTEMEWSLDEETGCVSGDLEGETETQIDDNFLMEIADVLQNGIECFVLESTKGETTNDAITRRKNKAIQG